MQCQVRSLKESETGPFNSTKVQKNHAENVEKNENLCSDAVEPICCGKSRAVRNKANF